MTSPAPPWPTRVRTPDDLVRDARAIRRLLDDLEPDDHAARIRLVAAQDVVRLEAAAQWRARGWRPITDTRIVVRRERTMLLAPASAALVAAVVSHQLLGVDGAVVTLLVLLCAAPLAAEAREASQRTIRRLAATATAAIAVYVGAGVLATTAVFLPAAVLLLAIAALGTAPRG